MSVDGARQLAGQDVNPYYGHDVVENTGMIAGQAALLIGTSVAMRYIPGVGRFAPIAAGGTLGFLMPTHHGR